MEEVRALKSNLAVRLAKILFCQPHRTPASTTTIYYAYGHSNNNHNSFEVCTELISVYQKWACIDSNSIYINSFIIRDLFLFFFGY